MYTVYTKVKESRCKPGDDAGDGLLLLGRPRRGNAEVQHTLRLDETPENAGGRTVSTQVLINNYYYHTRAGRHCVALLVERDQRGSDIAIHINSLVAIIYIG